VAGRQDFMIGNAPQPASYAGNPQLGLQVGDRLAQLPERYEQGQQLAVTQASLVGRPAVRCETPRVLGVAFEMVRRDPRPDQQKIEKICVRHVANRVLIPFTSK
jgi:hypothetical protein